METLRVHIAELVIATDPAAADVTIADSISERAESKGLAIVAREIVADLEEAIRAQLERFIGDPNVDVVIATGVAESQAASNALRPLVTLPVPGFTDLFRWLAYQEIGASAMLSNAEAAQCSSTFVFVLPAVKGAVREAMDKLILPQLDPATQPKNLIQQIPRLAPLVIAARAAAPPPTVETPRPEAVPHRIEAERTESGPGISARLPAASPGSRAAHKTGPHVIRKEPVPDVTRQIDRNELERTLKRSESNDAVTKPAIDIRGMLPKVPPGADEGSDEVGDTTDLTDMPAPQPLARVKLVAKGDVEAKTTEQPRKKPPTIQIPPVKPGKTKTSEEITEELRPVVAVRKDEKSGPVRVPELVKKEKSGAVRVPELVKKDEKRVPPALQKRTPPSQDVVSIADLVKAAPDLGLEPETLPMRMRPTPMPKRQPSMEIALEANELEPATDEDYAKAEAAAAPPEPRKRPVTEPPPPPKKRAITEPPALQVPDKKQPPPRAARTPTEPPKPRETGNDLPRGKFVYPVKQSATGKIVKWGALALVAAAAGIAFVHFFLATKEEKKVAVVAVADARVVETPVDAEAVVQVEPTTIDAAIPDIEIDVPIPDGSAAKPQPHPTHPVGGGHPRHPVVPETGSGAGSGSAVVATGSASTPPDDPTCDEVSCVMEKYARACCARYKPTDTGFKPSAGGELDKVMVRTGIEGVKPRVIACGEKFAAKGTVSISMTVSPEGAVKSATVADSPTPEIGACVAQALKSASFAKTAKGGSFTYPFVF